MRIVATNLAVSSHAQSSQELAPLIRKSADWIIKRTGVSNRYTSEELKDPAILAAEAACPIVKEYGPPDLLIFAGTLPRQILPDMSIFVHRELGLESTPSFSVNMVCLSFLTALKVAEGFIATNTYGKILICCSELGSRGRNFKEAESAALLGDGAAAVLVESNVEGDSQSGFESFKMQTWSEGAELTTVRGGGTFLHPSSPDVKAEDYLFQMDGKAIMKFTIPRLRTFIKSFLDDAQIAPEDIDLVVPHQPSGPALQWLSRWGFREERIVNIISQYGNCAAASMPMALAIAQHERNIQPGDRVLFLGTAAGISIGAGLFKW